jgi:hypothetical protein
VERVVDVYRATFGWLRDRLTPENRYGEPPRSVEVLEWIRTGGTILLLAGVSWLYTGFGEAGRLINAPVVNTLLALPAMLVAIVVVLAAAHRAQRREVARSLGRPLAVTGVVAAALLAFAVVIEGFNRLWHGGGVSLRSVLLGCCVGAPVSIVFLVYVIPAVLWGCFLAVRHWFRAADGHPMLPGVMTCAYAVAEVVNLLVRGPDDAMPAAVALLIGVGCPIGLAATGLVEIQLLRRAGYSLRTLPAQVPGTIRRVS